MSSNVVIKQEETEVDVDVDTINISSRSSYGQVSSEDVNWTANQ
jgi:hypothetical protein